MKTSSRMLVGMAVLLAAIAGVGIVCASKEKPRHEGATREKESVGEVSVATKAKTPSSPPAVRAEPARSAAAVTAPASWFRIAPIEQRREDELETEYQARVAAVRRYRAFAQAARLTAVQDAQALEVLAGLQLNYENFGRSQRNLAMETSGDKDRTEVLARLEEVRIQAIGDMNADAKKELGMVLDERQMEILDIHVGLETLHTIVASEPFDIEVGDGGRVEGFKRIDDPKYLEQQIGH